MWKQESQWAKVPTGDSLPIRDPPSFSMRWRARHWSLVKLLFQSRDQESQANSTRACYGSHGARVGGSGVEVWAWQSWSGWITYRLLSSVSFPSMLNSLPPQLLVVHGAPGGRVFLTSLPGCPSSSHTLEGVCLDLLRKELQMETTKQPPCSSLICELSPVEGEQGQV